MSFETEAPKAAPDVASVGVIVATFADWLPAIAAIVSIVWGLLRIWETRTVQGWLGRPTRAGSRDDDA